MTGHALLQSSTNPVAQPTYVLRGHSAQIHSLCFKNENTRLLSGDADGWVVLWDLVVKRPVAVWRAHEKTILGIDIWQEDKIITHGRDNTLKVWQLRPEDESTFSTVLPVDDANAHRKQPWLLHCLDVNAMNFCSFAMCRPDTKSDESVLIAVPAVKDTEIDVFELPSEKRVYNVPALSVKTGMAMTLSIFYRESILYLIAGYEGGHTAVHRYDGLNKEWKTDYTCQAHTQPVLSLDICLAERCYFTSGADDAIIRHPLSFLEDPYIKNISVQAAPDKVVHTKHSGQQALRVRSDGKIFATAGWDSRIRVYSIKTIKELAVLKWHKEGCYATAFAHMRDETAMSAYKGEGDAEKRIVLTAQQRREQKVKEVHWLAAGSKDGKVSLWDIY